MSHFIPLVVQSHDVRHTLHLVKRDKNSDHIAIIVIVPKLSFTPVATLQVQFCQNIMSMGDGRPTA
eukprot:scaffold76016_cov21-Prasinocladus_malaysianus.AAC.1